MPENFTFFQVIKYLQCYDTTTHTITSLNKVTDSHGKLNMYPNIDLNTWMI